LPYLPINQHRALREGERASGGIQLYEDKVLLFKKLMESFPHRSGEIIHGRR